MEKPVAIDPPPIDFASMLTVLLIGARRRALQMDPVNRAPSESPV